MPKPIPFSQNTNVSFFPVHLYISGSWLPEGEKKHFASTSFASLNTLDQKSPHCVSLMLFDEKECRFSIFGFVEKSIEGTSVFGGIVDTVPVVELIKYWNGLDQIFELFFTHNT